MMNRTAARIWLYGILCLAALTLSASACGTGSVTLPSTSTFVPPDFSILAPFTPSYRCELQNVEISDTTLCRNEQVQESIAGQSDKRLLIQHNYHVGQGCWSGINTDQHDLRVCDRQTGQTAVLATHMASTLVKSPDGAWFAFTTFTWDLRPTQGALPLLHVYRVWSDGAVLQRLDTGGLPSFAVGAELVGWSPEGAWLELRLWDGTENGWHRYRLRADGSGMYEPRDGSIATTVPPPGTGSMHPSTKN
ncbi:MAG TPA: hypothetical protein VMT24_02615 [Aggregatilineaceae bacterium]|nr:hypothetical protein [Aggregatilineaceae bacterium]